MWLFERSWMGPFRNMNLLKSISFVVLFLVLFLNNVKCDMSTDDCNFGTCGECISYAHSHCVWCAQDVFDDRRCQPISSIKTKENWCEKEFIKNPQSSIKILANRGFTEIINKANVQFKPQLIKITARPGVPIHFNMSYKPAVDFPIDVYYLMDVSYSMERQMQTLKEQAQIIYNDLLRYTNNVRLGLGTFIDKNAVPICDDNRDHRCHSFINRVSLTNNMTIFESAIANIKFGANFDTPEGGLDGLMQAMTCEKEIGWRPGARRIILLCTDSTYHSAGDGKIVGAIKPHDMQCHLENNTYTKFLTFDYPSISQINKIASEKNFKIIFAITRNVLTGNDLPEEEYQALAKQILGAKYAKLKTTNTTIKDGNDVLKIIKEAYEESARYVPLKYNPPPFIQLDLDQHCGLKSPRNCETTHSQPIVTIPGKLTVQSCPPSGRLHHKFEIAPIGLDEKLTIDLDIICNCDCEKTGGENSPKCHNTGVFQCGVCKCNSGSYGVDCRCNGTSTDQKDMEKCRLNPDDVKLCSGRGKCRCGKCEECPKGFSGDFCEFDDNSCPRPNGQLCFGKGICSRGRCRCDAYWTGNDCSCPVDDAFCYAPYSTEVCSGNGVCQCGVCVCNAMEGKNETYLGVFCDDCEECAEKRCKELEDYALCYYEHIDNRDFCDKNKNVSITDLSVTFMNKTEINGPQLYMAKWCKKELDNGTLIVFKYQHDTNRLKLFIQTELDVIPAVNMWIAVGSSIGLVLLIGIITVIVWKILVDLHDRREYQKFKNEAAAAGYDVAQNPLYVAPANDFSNPMYDERCQG